MLDKVLLALDELERWSARDTRSRVVRDQIAYYGALVADMKRELCRPGLTTFMRTFK
jgi:hypothetical protein